MPNGWFWCLAAAALCYLSRYSTQNVVVVVVLLLLRYTLFFMLLLLLLLLLLLVFPVAIATADRRILFPPELDLSTSFQGREVSEDSRWSAFNQNQQQQQQQQQLCYTRTTADLQQASNIDPPLPP
jgi:hypothetical protein